jgi:protein-L-isoaspartate O-methyltransferase
MANDHQFKTKSKIVATRGVAEYRDTIEHLIEPADVVLEVGCEWGTTTVQLARAAGRVIGTDISLRCVERARHDHPELEFAVLDAFDVMAVARQDIPYSVIYLDLSGLSGYRGLLDLIALLNTYAAVLEPRLMVVKSGALKHFASLCTPWRPV